MSDDAEQIAQWVEAFKETQRQMTHAHETYQRALAESHQKYLRAVGESQERLVTVLERYGVDPDQTVLMTPGSDENTARFLRARNEGAAELSRAVPITRTAPAPGRPFSALREGATICVVPDGLGLAHHVVELLNMRGYWASPSEVPIAADLILVLSGLQKGSAAMKTALEDAMRAVFEVEHGGVVLVQDTGGEFGLDSSIPSNSYQNGMKGLAEWAQKVSAHKVKNIDLDVGFRKLEEVALALVGELLSGGDEPFVGLPEGGRVTWALAEPEDRGDVIDFEPGVLLITASVGSWDGLISRLAQNWKGRAVVIGAETTADVDRIPCDMMDTEAIFAAIEVAREQGVLRRWIHFPVCRGGTHNVASLAEVWKSDIVPFHVVMAATAADPLRQIAIVNSIPEGVGHVTTAVLSAIALAEDERRGEETHVVALMVDPAGDGEAIRNTIDLEGRADVRLVSRAS